MKLKLGVASLVVGAIASAAPSAEAAGDAKGFADKGNLIISADRLVPLFSYTRASQDTPGPNGSTLTDSVSGTGLSLFGTTDLSLGGVAVINVHSLPRVAADIAVIDRLTLGAALAFGFGLGGSTTNERANAPALKTDTPTATAIGVAPRVGYILPLSEAFAFWPRAGIGFYSVSLSSDAQVNNATVTTTNKDTFWSLDLDPQFALVPIEHFFIHGGPVINVPLSTSRSTSFEQNGSKTTVSTDVSLFHFGLHLGLGGWFSIF